MATESLIVELDAQTKKLDSKVKESTKNLEGLDKQTQENDKSLAKFSKAAGAAALAITGVATAISLAINQASAFARELEVASNRAGISVEEMQSLAFATSTVGISLEKIGNISKDTQERIGEFIKTGSGGFMDFVDVLGLTQMEAQKVAEEFALLSGPEILQEMINRMQAAEISTKEMSFALEGMASDATDLIPLLKDNGDSLKALKEQFDGLNSTISKADLDKIKNVGIELDKATTIFSQEGKQLVADYSEELIKAIGVTTLIAQKTADTFNVIVTGFGNLIDLAGAALNDFINGTETFEQTLQERTQASQEALLELLGESYYDLGFSAGQSMADGVADGLKENNKALQITITEGKKLSDWEKLNSKQRLGVQQQFIKAASILSNEFLEDNKAVNAGLVIADTAAGIMKALATSSNIYEGFANAAIVGATGLVQLNNVLSAQKGGGSISGGSGTASSSRRANTTTSK